MLGLGDIVMPGLLLCFVMRYDAYKKAQQAKLAEAGIPLPSNWLRISYFHCSLFGYFLGLLTATISSEVSKAVSQPLHQVITPFISRSLKRPNQLCCIWYPLHCYHYLQWPTLKVILNPCGRNLSLLRPPQNTKQFERQRTTTQPTTEKLAIRTVFSSVNVQTSLTLTDFSCPFRLALLMIVLPTLGTFKPENLSRHCRTPASITSLHIQCNNCQKPTTLGLITHFLHSQPQPSPPILSSSSVFLPI